MKKSKYYIQVLETMCIGNCTTEKEAVEYAIKCIKKCKKLKRKYAELLENQEHEREVQDAERIRIAERTQNGCVL